MKKSLLALVAGVMVLGSGVADAKTLKFQISSKSGDWAHNYLTAVSYTHLTLPTIKRV